MLPVSAAFTALIPRRHTRSSRVTWVALDLTTGSFTEIAVLTGAGGVVTSYTVTIDRSRVIRRTADVAVAEDRLGTYTPDMIGDPLYLFSMLRIQRGLYVDGEPEYVDLGYFVVDQPSSSFTARSGSHRVALSDRLTMAAEARFVDPISFAEDVRVQDYERALAELAGLGTADVLYDLDDGGSTLGFARAHEVGESIIDAMFGAAADHALDLFMNAQSVLTLEPLSDPNLLPTSYAFVGGPEAILTSITKTLSAQGWFNVCLAVGDAPDLPEPIVGRAEVTDPASPSHRSKIGVRVKPVTVSAGIRDQSQADAVALADLYQSALEVAQVTGQHVVHPALEAGDVISIHNDRAKLDDRFVLDVVRHPSEGVSTFETRRIRSLIA